MFLLSSWLFLAILSGLASNTFAFLSRFILKDKDDFTVFAWYMELFRFVIFSLIAIFNWKLVITAQSLFVLFLLGVTEFASGYFYMKMHAYTHLSISTILSRTRLIWVPIFGFFILHEFLTIPNYLGIAVIFLGVTIIMAPKKIFMDKGAVSANISAVFIALNTVLLAFALPFASNAVLLAVGSLPSIFLYPIFMKNTPARIKKLTYTNLSLKSLAGCVSVVQLLIFIAALHVGDASKVNAVYQGMLIFSVLSGILILHETKDIRKKLIGTFITVIGVLVLSFL